MPIPTTPKHGRGKLNILQKGETANPNGRPRALPKTIKDIIKSFDTAEEDIKFSENVVEKVVENGKVFYKIKGSSGQKLILSIWQKAMAGSIPHLDYLTKMGLAGGYEPTKTEQVGDKLDNTTFVVEVKSINETSQDGSQQNISAS